jgi:RNA polymerase sigma factor (sigma-70 family)
MNSEKIANKKIMSNFDIIQTQVKAALAGEEAAWTALYTHYHAGLYAIALKMCNNISIAEDIVQDAFITAYIKLPQLKDADTFGGWIRKILIHLCYRASGKNKTTRNLNSISAESDIWWEDEFHKKLELLSVQSRLYSALAQLPEVLQTTLLLRYFSSFQSYEEIAGILSIPLGTVRSRLNQAKQKLAEQWQQYKNNDEKLLQEAEEWNSFYHATFSQMHRHDHYKNRLIAHLQKDIHLTMPNGKSNIGRSSFEKMIVDDREAGSWLSPSNVTSCANISIIENTHFNSPENPSHCPPRSVLVLYRNERKVNKINFHVFLQ